MNFETMGNSIKQIDINTEAEQLDIARQAIQKILHGENISGNEKDSILNEGLDKCHLHMLLVRHNVHVIHEGLLGNS